jgi:hypothetical protein
VAVGDATCGPGRGVVKPRGEVPETRLRWGAVGVGAMAVEAEVQLTEEQHSAAAALEVAVGKLPLAAAADESVAGGGV